MPTRYRTKRIYPIYYYLKPNSVISDDSINYQDILSCRTCLYDSKDKSICKGKTHTGYFWIWKGKEKTYYAALHEGGMITIVKCYQW